MPFAENQLIDSLPHRDRLGLLKVCELVQLALPENLVQAGEITRHVYFPIDGFISLVRPVDGHEGLEVGMVGREGMVGAQVALGVATSPLRALVQGAGSARRVSAASFRAHLAASPASQRCIQRYICVLMEQLATSATCLRFHLIGPRLARWLLMSQDRAHADSFFITQEILAVMLGVRRVGITGAASSLQRDEIIAYRRGRVTVLDRARLEEAACSCYQSDCDSYVSVM